MLTKDHFPASFPEKDRVDNMVILHDQNHAVFHKPLVINGFLFK
jgi:hypothetical protein